MLTAMISSVELSIDQLSWSWSSSP